MSEIKCFSLEKNSVERGFSFETRKSHEDFPHKKSTI